MPFVYGLVARWKDEEVAGDVTVLVKYAQKGLDLRPEPCLRRIDRCNRGLTTFTAGEYACSFISRGSFVYGTVSYDDKRSSLYSAVLERIISEVTIAFEEDELMSAGEDGLQQKFEGALKKILTGASSNPREFEQAHVTAHTVQRDMYGVKMLMVKNVESVISRGEKLSSVEKKTMKLKDDAQKFKMTGKRVKQEMQQRSCAAKAVWLAVALLGFTAILLAIYLGATALMQHLAEDASKSSGGAGAKQQ